MPKSNHSKSSTTKALEKATKDWRSAKKRERAARNALAAIVNEAVASGVMSENKVASITEIPRMTIRKMLGKDEPTGEAPAADEPTGEAPAADEPTGESAPEAMQVVEAVPDVIVEAGVSEAAAAPEILEPQSAPVDAEAATDVSDVDTAEPESPITAMTSRPGPA